MFYAQEAAAGESFDRRRGAVGGSVVEQVDVNALLDQVADDLIDDVRFVIRGDDRDNGQLRRHAPAFYPSLPALPGEGPHHRLADDPVLALEAAVVMDSRITTVLDLLGQNRTEQILRPLQAELGV